MTGPAAPRSGRRTLAGRLTFWFLAIALAPLAAVMTIASWAASRAAEDHAREALANAADEKVEAIETYCQWLQQSVAALARAPSVVEAVADLSKVPAGPATQSDSVKELETFLVYAADAFHFADLWLIAPTGDVLFVARSATMNGTNVTSGAYAESELALLVERVQALVQTDASNFQRYPEVTEPMAFVAGPVLGGDGKVVGVLACIVDNGRLERVLNDHGGLGATGETVVASRFEGRTVLVAPTRHDRSAAFSRVAPSGAVWAAPLEAGLAGEPGFGVVEDYRGMEVVAVWRHLPSFRWGVMVKQDVDEAFASAREVRWRALALAGLLLPAVVVSALVVARSIARPLRAAAEAARSVAGGDLTATIDVVARDEETGELLRSLRAMIGGLHSLVGRVRTLSVDLTATAAQLAATGREQEDSAARFASSTGRVADDASTIAATSRDLQEAMDVAGLTAAGTAALADEGRDGLKEMGGAMRRLAGGADSVGAKLTVIRDEAAGIRAMVETITKVADQTNLLSLNAAIEAEKAGEYGRGFLVVSREIRRLADQTAGATLDIAQIVGRMDAAVTAGAREMERFGEEVHRGVTVVDETVRTLGRIIDGARVVGDRFGTVQDGTRTQADGARRIHEAMEEVSEDASRTARSASELKSAADLLRDAIVELERQIAGFRVETDPGLGGHLGS